MSRFVVCSWGGLSVGTNLSGSKFLFLLCLELRLGGRSRSGEALGSLGTAVPQDDSSKGGAAHGPRHPRALIFFAGCYV